MVFVTVRSCYVRLVKGLGFNIKDLTITSTIIGKKMHRRVAICVGGSCFVLC